MAIKLARKRGFCMGVRRAMDGVDEALEQGRELTTLGPLIHNPQTIEKLNAAGVEVAEEYTEVTDRTVVVRTHGITPALRKEIKQSGRTILDLTCPLVSEVHGTARKYARKGYDVVIVGNPRHPEVIGILGHCEGRGQVVSSVEEVANLPDCAKVAVVSQSTQGEDVFAAVSEAIQERFSEAVINDTICGSTHTRQAAARGLVEEEDIQALVVIGGKHSSNTGRLADVGRNRDVPTYLIETEDELKRADFEGITEIGVTAGASTPDWIIDRVVQRLQDFTGLPVEDLAPPPDDPAPVTAQPLAH